MKLVLKLVLKLVMKLVLKLVLVVCVVERSKKKNGSKRSQEMEDVSHRKTMPLAAGKSQTPKCKQQTRNLCALEAINTCRNYKPGSTAISGKKEVK